MNSIIDILEASNHNLYVLTPVDSFGGGGPSENSSKMDCQWIITEH